MSLSLNLVAPICALCLLFSLPSHAMIWVGTPVGLLDDPMLGPVQGGLHFDAALLYPCSGAPPLALGQASVALGAHLPLPAGTWCGLELLDAVLVVVGETAEGDPLDLEIHASEAVFDVPDPVTLAPGLPAPRLQLSLDLVEGSVW